MQSDFDLNEDGSLTIKKNRGGRPVGYSPGMAANLQEQLERGEDPYASADPDSDAGRLSTTVKTAIAKARKETALAGLNELELKIKTGQYLPRAAYREASATLLATLSQGLRSIPDTLERKHGLSPDILTVIEHTIDDALSQVAETLQMFTGEEE